jgi:undecaprenyl diphosphate synthase
MSAKPNHLAIIPDGNRRWTREHGLTESAGYKKGVETSIKIARYLRNIGVHTFTLWGFSRENWGRHEKERSSLFALVEILESYVREAVRNDVRIVHLGSKDRLPSALLNRIKKAEEETAHLKKHILNIAFDYGGRDEIVRAIKKMDASKFNISELNEENIGQFLDTSTQPYPDPDLIIRTSGERRTSGLLPWQSVYSELIFIDKYYPDLTEDDIKQAIDEFMRRKRRFGK